MRSAVGKAGAAGAVGAAGAAGAVAYTPHLNPAELREAAAALDIAQRDVEARAAAARRAARDLAGTGFAGPAAANALSRTTELAGALDARAASMARMRMVLEAAAAAQQMLDLAAATALRYGHYRTVLWLNQLSLQLDTELARELNRARGAGFQPLANSPGEDLHALSARHMATLPAATRGHVEAVGGLVLEAGPASTTVMVGDAVDPARIITMVAGATTGHPDQLAHELEKAQLIAQRTGATVVVWQGYQPPKELGRALSPASASEGSGNLALFQAALEERFPRAQKTVVAHSYGTRVATQAASEHGLLADDLWLLGSPGVAGRSVADLTLAGPDARVMVVDADRDPILALRSGPQGVLGASPSHEAYGAEVVPGVRGDHGAYFTDEAFLTALSQASHPEREKSLPSANGNWMNF
ncbi:hypothetical protein JZY91_09835 [Corynebacterium sp. CNCTC7651]|uniref:alpha/beta hydrolase n=1 Tax=Corynebacterium sp. CNCTC7651 TaxID=2815361 RepID=UPI001F331FEF|nr:alpha/beta hydrolase [Corynebacterium sp. CNCTC7651]UIZ91968.1 hypothetical protein JZY91_09835 [Corynebacterium sp. CNCTC7651]